MAPKKKGGKKKEVEPTEPPHDPYWEKVRSMQFFVCELHFFALKLPETILTETVDIFYDVLIFVTSRESFCRSRHVRNLNQNDKSFLFHPPLCVFHQAVETGIWERPVDALPDAMQWPTWGALRERILTSCREIKIVQSSSVRDPFATELVRLSPANLHTLSFKGSDSLESFVLSPLGSCGELKSIDLTGCKRLEYVLIQSDSLETLSVALCGALKTLILHCRGLQRLDVRDCLEMEVRKASVLMECYRDQRFCDTSFESIPHSDTVPWTYIHLSLS